MHNTNNTRTGSNSGYHHPSNKYLHYFLAAFMFITYAASIALCVFFALTGDLGFFVCSIVMCIIITPIFFLYFKQK